MDYFLSNANFPGFVRKLLESSRVLAPIEQHGRNYIQAVNQDNIDSINLSGFRTVEPCKSAFFAVSEVVSEYFAGQGVPDQEQITILGARGCDLEALEVEDRVFEGDAFYDKRRQNSFIVGADCTSCGKTCFCTLVGGKPYALQRFDLNFSIVGGGYLVEVGSAKGKQFIEENQGLFAQAGAGMRDEVRGMRERVEGLLEEVNKDYKFKTPIYETHKINLENPAWKVLTKDCVECSGCNLICPTCTCFFLADQPAESGGERHKIWDACLKSGYQKVAGGANARGKLYQRLQNRYHCKMDYSHTRLDRYTCVGCGRCIDGCAGNIDMRKIFAELERLAPLTAKLV